MCIIAQVQNIFDFFFKLEPTAKNILDLVNIQNISYLYGKYGNNLILF